VGGNDGCSELGRRVSMGRMIIKQRDEKFLETLIYILRSWERQ